MSALRVDDGNGNGKKVAAPTNAPTGIGTVALMEVARHRSASDRLRDLMKTYRTKVEERDELALDIVTMLAAGNVGRAIDLISEAERRYFGRNVGLRYTLINHVWYGVNKGETAQKFDALDNSVRLGFLSSFAKTVEDTAETFERHVFGRRLFEKVHRDERRMTKGGARDLRRIAGHAYLMAGLEADAHRVFDEGVTRHINAGFDASAVRIEEEARRLFSRDDAERPRDENGDGYRGGQYL